MLTVYLPVAGAAAERLIDRGSGIVGEVVGERVSIYYEGNRYGAENIKTFADRLYHAGARLRRRYPTLATALVSSAEVEAIGVWDEERGEAQIEAGKLPALTAWLGVDTVEHSELRATHAAARPTPGL